MSPEKFVDESFTKSSKGLMTLFAIGVIKVFIGVKFTSTEITIPWLPNVQLEHLNNIIYLYWSFLAYVLYRYCLHNTLQIGHLNARAMVEYLGSTKLGKWFAYKFIFQKEEFFQMTLRSDNDMGIHSARILSYSAMDIPTEHFDLIFDNSMLVNKAKAVVNEHMDGTIHACVGIDGAPSKWGQFILLPQTSEENREYITSFIESPFIRCFLSLMTLYFTIRLMLKSPHTFDVFMPIALNIGLFIYWLASQAI